MYSLLARTLSPICLQIFGGFFLVTEDIEKISLNLSLRFIVFNSGKADIVGVVSIYSLENLLSQGDTDELRVEYLSITLSSESNFNFAKVSNRICSSFFTSYPLYSTRVVIAEIHGSQNQTVFIVMVLYQSHFLILIFLTLFLREGKGYALRPL